MSLVDRLAPAVAWAERLAANGYRMPKVVNGRVVWPKKLKKRA